MQITPVLTMGNMSTLFQCNNQHTCSKYPVAWGIWAYYPHTKNLFYLQKYMCCNNI